jgi:hypothetical protein
VSGRIGAYGAASLLAVALLFALQQAFAARVAGIVFLPLPWVAAVLGVVIALAWLASWLVLSRVLRTVGP